jgi:hypothetical protein
VTQLEADAEADLKYRRTLETTKKEFDDDILLMII